MVNLLYLYAALDESSDRQDITEIETKFLYVYIYDLI